jgi:3-hydroxyacyl-CoA dehydrogenase
MSPSEPVPGGRVAVLGGGLIGRSWTALFLAAGRSVTVYDPDPATEARITDAVEAAWPVLTTLGLTRAATPSTELVHCDDPRAAAEGAGFVQESIPERLDLKHELYAAIEPVLADGAVVASSASGLTLSELQRGWRRPDRFVLGHPFNPPHLIPLVEVMGNERTGTGVVGLTRRFYESVGKVTIEVRREGARTRRQPAAGRTLARGDPPGERGRGDGVRHRHRDLLRSRTALGRDGPDPAVPPRR